MHCAANSPRRVTVSMNLPAISPSQHCLACIAYALCPHFISLVSGDSRMNPLIHLDIPAITLYIGMRFLLLTMPDTLRNSNYRSVFACLLAYCNSVPWACIQPSCWLCRGRGPFQGEDKQCDEQCQNHQHFLLALKCFNIIPKNVRSDSTEVDCLGFDMSWHFFQSPIITLCSGNVWTMTHVKTHTFYTKYRSSHLKSSVLTVMLL